MHRDDFQTFMQPFQNQIQEQKEKRESAAMEKLGKAESQTAMGFGVATTVDDGQGTVVASWLTDADREHLRSRNESLLERPAREMQQVVLEDLEIIATLGTGTCEHISFARSCPAPLPSTFAHIFTRASVHIRLKTTKRPGPSLAHLICSLLPCSPPFNVRTHIYSSSLSSPPPINPRSRSLRSQVPLERSSWSATASRGRSTL